MHRVLGGEAVELEWRRRCGIIVPEGWHDAERTAPVEPNKTKITIALDADMVRWFRGFGRGYQRRMNAVMRAYMLAVVSKEIEQMADCDLRGDPL